VTVYGVPGPLVSYIEKLGLRFIPARPLKYRPAPSRIYQLASIARRERLDLIHAYEWPPTLDAFFGAGLLGKVPIVSTVLSMSVSKYIPPSVPLIMGTDELGDEARKRHRGDVWVIEPPIDVQSDHPDLDKSAFRGQLQVRPDEILVVTVSRLSIDLKVDALVNAIDSVAELAKRFPVRLAIVGGGPVYEALRARATEVNKSCDREVILFTGPTLDPRPAYAAADIVVGMGSSAMRAMAIGRPVVVQGERGFSLPFQPDTLPVFLSQGFYGVGTGDGQGGQTLARHLEALIVDASERHRLGEYGSRLVRERFSLERAAFKLLEIYDKVREKPPDYRSGEALRAAALALQCEVNNHDPRVKSKEKEALKHTLAYVRSGAGR
jgi:glycosyltransferase involved in cell wall biosynthesis